MSERTEDVTAKPRVKTINHIGEYQIDRLLGTGVDGKVYKATGKKNERLAIKVLARDMAKDACCVECFEENAAAAAELSHPNIVRVHEIGQFKGRYYFTMEYFRCKNLREFIEGGRRLSGEEALSMMRQAASALDYANAHNVVHGHLTPGNVLIGNDGVLKLTDFGTAGAEPAHHDEEETRQETPVDDMDKTVLEGRLDPCDLKSRDDMQSVGVFLFEMLTGKMLDDEMHKMALSESQLDLLPADFRPLVAQLSGEKPTIETPGDLLHALDFITPKFTASESSSAIAAPDSTQGPTKNTDPEALLQTHDIAQGKRTPSWSASTVEPAENTPDAPVGTRRSALNSWLRRIAVVATATSVVLLAYGLAFKKPMQDRPSVNTETVPVKVAGTNEQTSPSELTSADDSENPSETPDAAAAEIDIASQEDAQAAEPVDEQDIPVQPEVAPEEPVEAGTSDTDSEAPADVPANVVSTVQTVATTTVAAGWQKHASELARLLTARRYESACTVLDSAAADELLKPSVQRWKSYIDEGIRFWERAARGARKAAGRERSLTVRAGTGTIQMEGKIEGVNDDALLSITTAGMEYTCNVRELLFEDALEFANDIETTSNLSRVVLHMLELNLDGARASLKSVTVDDDAASQIAIDLDNPDGLAQLMARAQRTDAMKATIASANAKAKAGDIAGATRMLRLELGLWDAGSEADEIQKAIDALPAETARVPASDNGAEKLWEKIESAAKEGEWKDLLGMAKVLEKRYAKSQIVERNGSQLEDLKSAAEVGLAIDAARRADAGLEQSVPLPNPPRVATVTATKGDMTISDVLNKQPAGILVIGKGEYVERVSVKGKKGTKESPFALLGVPGNGTVLSSLKNVESRPGKDKGTVWIPWMDKPPTAALLQGDRPLKATRSAPSDPGSYFIDQKAKRCLIVPFPGEEQPTIRIPVLTGGCSLSVDATPHILVRDMAFEQPAATISIGKGSQTVVLQRITTWQQGAMNIDTGQVMIKDSIITSPVSIRCGRLLASYSVFESVKLSSADPGAEIVFDNCLILGGVQLSVPAPKRVEFRNCTFIGCSNSIEMESGTNLVITDSIFTKSSESAVLLKAAGQDYQLKNVCMWQNGADFGGVAAETKVIALSPMFSAQALGDLRLRKESPCRGKGSNKKDIGLDWSDAQWGRWFRFLKGHYATGLLGTD